jgi:SSS family solute:Na+ symporter
VGLRLLLTGVSFAKRMNAMKLLSLPDICRIHDGRGIEAPASPLMIFSFCILPTGNLVAGGFLFERLLGTSYLGGVLIIVAIVLTYTLAGGRFSDAYSGRTGAARGCRRAGGATCHRGRSEFTARRSL